MEERIPSDESTGGWRADILPRAGEPLTSHTDRRLMAARNMGATTYMERVRQREAEEAAERERQMALLAKEQAEKERRELEALEKRLAAKKARDEEAQRKREERMAQQALTRSHKVPRGARWTDDELRQAVTWIREGRSLEQMGKEMRFEDPQELFQVMRRRGIDPDGARAARAQELINAGEDREAVARSVGYDNYPIMQQCLHRLGYRVVLVDQNQDVKVRAMMADRLEGMPWKQVAEKYGYEDATYACRAVRLWKRRQAAKEKAGEGK